MLAKFAVRNITRNRRRTIVAISTIAVGVFGLLFLQAFFSGLLRLHAENSIHSRHGHGQIFTAGYFEKTYETPHEHWLQSPEQLVSGLESLPEVEAAFPRVQFFALLSNGDINVAGRGQGVVGVKEKDFFHKMNFVAGGPIGEQEDGIVMGVGLAKSLGLTIGDNVTVLGQTVHGTLNGIDATLTGIFHVGMKEADDVLFQVQLSAAHTLLDTDKVESVAVGLKQAGTWSAVDQYASQHLRGLEALHVYEIDAAWAKNGQSFLTALMNIFRLTFLGMILLAIYNTASTTVLERKRELGMLRANGESASDVIKLIVYEGAAVALIGAAIGLFGIVLVDQLMIYGIPMPPTPGTNRQLPVELDLLWGQVTVGVVLAVGTCIGATWFSALQVTKIPIVQALRTPS